MNSKICNGIICKGADININLFRLAPSRKDGLAPICVNCKKEYDKIYKNKNKDKIFKYMKQYNIDNKDHISKNKKQKYQNNKEKIRDYRKRHYQNNKKQTKTTNNNYYQNNKENIIIKNREWENNNKDKVKYYKRKWKLNNPQNASANVRKRRAKKLAVNEDYTKQDEQLTREFFNHCCFNCRSTQDLCIDHNLPLSKGFALSLSNAVLLCKSCNASKGTKLPEEFYNAGKLRSLRYKLNKLSRINH